jgi:TIR domain.
MANGYVFDVFLSYKRNLPVEPWVRQFFLPNLRSWLKEEIGGYSPKIFFDQESIDWGERWRDGLEDGLRTSKILLAVCSPSYFRSPWCSLEWETFALREKAAGSNRLRIPITHNDGQHFPQDARDLQAMSFSDCVSVMPIFPHHPMALKLEEKIRALVPAIARALKDVPEFQDSWPIAKSARHIQIIKGESVIEPDDISNVSSPLQTL